MLMNYALKLSVHWKRLKSILAIIKRQIEVSYGVIAIDDMNYRYWYDQLAVLLQSCISYNISLFHSHFI